MRGPRTGAAWCPRARSSSGRRSRAAVANSPGSSVLPIADRWRSRACGRSPDTEDGERVESCTIVTAPANALMAEIHNTRKRMPVVLEGRLEQDAWLNGTKGEALAVAEPLADGLLDAHRISTRINNPNARGRELLEPLSAP